MIWKNAGCYNCPGSRVHEAALSCAEEFAKIWAECRQQCPSVELSCVPWLEEGESLGVESSHWQKDSSRGKRASSRGGGGASSLVDAPTTQRACSRERSPLSHASGCFVDKLAASSQPSSFATPFALPRMPTQIEEAVEAGSIV